MIAGDEENGELAVELRAVEPIPAAHVDVKFAVAQPLISPLSWGTISRYLGRLMPLVNIWDTELVEVTPFI